jgi:hypothetical protein
MEFVCKRPQWIAVISEDIEISQRLVSETRLEPGTSEAKHALFGNRD